jgi:hypothetical protein
MWPPMFNPLANLVTSSKLVLGIAEAGIEIAWSHQMRMRTILKENTTL